MIDPYTVGGTLVVALTAHNISEYRHMRYKLLPRMEKLNGLEKTITLAEDIIESVKEENTLLQILTFGYRLGVEHYIKDSQ